MAKIKLQFYDPTRDLRTWSDWIDTDSLEFAAVKNWSDVTGCIVCEEMTKDQFKEYLKKFK